LRRARRAEASRRSHSLQATTLELHRCRDFDRGFFLTAASPASKTTGQHGRVDTGRFLLGGEGVFDLKLNDVIVDYPPIDDSPIFEIAGKTRGVLNVGMWDGNRIISVDADLDPRLAIAPAKASDLFAKFPALFRGQAVDDSAVLVNTTIVGNADLDRRKLARRRAASKHDLYRR
jgi:hypothetical protein